MPGNFKKEDLRVLKTKKALLEAMSKQLALRSFSQITVNDLCDEALISRTTFYLHFKDKYDLLTYWLEDIRPLLICDSDVYDVIVKRMSSFMYSNAQIIRNIYDSANLETTELLCDFISSCLRIKGENDPYKAAALSSFIAGGIMHYLLWQVKNKFSEDLSDANEYIYELLQCFMHLA